MIRLLLGVVLGILVMAVSGCVLQQIQPPANPRCLWTPVGERSFETQCSPFPVTQ